MCLNELREKYLDSVIEFKYGENILVLDKLVVVKEKRKLGIGTNIMEDLIAIADKNGYTIMLSPSDSLGATSRARLIRFYKRFGFVRNFGKTKQYHMPNYSMYRFPKTN